MSAVIARAWAFVGTFEGRCAVLVGWAVIVLLLSEVARAWGSSDKEDR